MMNVELRFQNHAKHPFYILHSTFCIQNMVRVTGLAPWWPCASTLLVPSPDASGLPTLHPEKLAARVGLAPTPNGLTGRRATLTLSGLLKLALPAGLAPASIRLEDERLVYFGHGSGAKFWIFG